MPAPDSAPPPGPDPDSTPAPSRPGLRHATAALKERDFAIFWSAAMVSNTGSWLQSAVVPFVLFQLTDNAAWIGIAGFAQFAPALAMGPLAGSLADRYPRRRILLVTQSLLGTGALALAVLWAAGVASAPAITAVVAFTGVAAGLNISAWQAFVSDLVPRHLLLNAVTLNSAQFNASRAFGPALAGVVLATLGPGWAFFLNAISFGAVIVALLFIRPRPRPTAVSSTSSGLPDDAIGPDGAPAVPPPRPRLVAEFRTTVRYLAARQGMLACVIVVTAMGLFGSPVFQLLSVFADEEFHVGRQAYGLLGASLGIGAVLGTPLVAGRGAGLPRSTLAGGGLLVYGAALTAFSLAPWFGLGVAALAVAGAAYLALAATLNTTIQLQVDEPMRGKVISLYLMALTGAIPVGALLQGSLAELFGPRPVVAVAGTCLVAMAIVLRSSGRLTRMDDDHATAATLAAERAAASDARPGVGARV